MFQGHRDNFLLHLSLSPSQTQSRADNWVHGEDDQSWQVEGYSLDNARPGSLLGGLDFALAGFHRDVVVACVDEDSGKETCLKVQPHSDTYRDGKPFGVLSSIGIGEGDGP